MSKNIFCIVGESGSGKNYYNNSIILDRKFIKKAKLKPLIYGTTREPKSGEVDGIDFHFISMEEYKKIPEEEIIDFRTYNTINGIKYYFTKADYIKEGKSNLIGITSLYQYESYRNWINLENIKNKDSYRLYLIVLDASVKNRLLRIIDRKCQTDEDIYETCRRIVEEKAEFDKMKSKIPELIDPMTYNTVLIINTNNISNEYNLANLNKIKQFILSKNI